MRRVIQAAALGLLAYFAPNTASGAVKALEENTTLTDRRSAWGELEKLAGTVWRYSRTCPNSCPPPWSSTPSLPAWAQYEWIQPGAVLISRHFDYFGSPVESEVYSLVSDKGVVELRLFDERGEATYVFYLEQKRTDEWKVLRTSSSPEVAANYSVFKITGDEFLRLIMIRDNGELRNVSIPIQRPSSAAEMAAEVKGSLAHYQRFRRNQEADRRFSERQAFWDAIDAGLKSAAANISTAAEHQAQIERRYRAPVEMTIAGAPTRTGEQSNAAPDQLSRVNSSGDPSLMVIPAGPQKDALATNSQSTPRSIAQKETLPVKSVPVFFSVSMQPTAQNTRNPRCRSNTFSVDIEFDPKGWGNAGRVAAIMDPMLDVFVAKCARLGKVSGDGTWSAEGITSGFPRSAPHPEDFAVQMP